MQITLDKNTELIINLLESAGFEAYAVGGCVRDSIKGREVTDYDITTSALPEQTKAVFANYTVIETGIKHGTVTVLMDNKPYEITTYRVESSYSDSRHPDNVRFVRDIKEDLARRDFTMNAVAYSPTRGIVDIFGGVADIKRNLLRTVGDPYQRFTEDALRILRALRFAATFGSKLELYTRDYAFELSHTLLNVSPERIYSELKKLLTARFAAEVLSCYGRALDYVLPNRQNLSCLSRLPKIHAMRFACVCGRDVESVLQSLHADNETKRVATLLVNSSPIPCGDEYAHKKYVSALGCEGALLVAIYRRALYNEDTEQKTEQLLSSGECLFIKDLAVDGNDLKQLGISGIAIGKVLRHLLDLVLKNELENKKEVLLAKAKDIDISLI